MPSSTSETVNCCCTPSSAIQEKSPPLKQGLKSIPSILLSVLIALFPKCPVCWAAYMSMFGSVGLANLPYMGWIFPILLVFLGIHIYALYKRSTDNSLLPFQLSVGGAGLILIGKFVLGLSWVSFLGMGCLILASLINSWQMMPMSKKAITA